MPRPPENPPKGVCGAESPPKICRRASVVQRHVRRSREVVAGAMATNRAHGPRQSWTADVPRTLSRRSPAPSETRGEPARVEVTRTVPSTERDSGSRRTCSRLLNSVFTEAHPRVLRNIGEVGPRTPATVGVRSVEDNSTHVTGDGPCPTAGSGAHATTSNRAIRTAERGGLVYPSRPVSPPLGPTR